jgi:hypothetical protein
MPVTSTQTRNQGELARALKSLGVDGGALPKRSATQAVVVAAHALQAEAGPSPKEVRTALGGGAANTGASTQSAAQLAPARSGKGGVLRHDVDQALARGRSPDAAQAIAVYRPKGKVERPLERALVHVGRLHTALAGKDTDQVMEWKASNDVRKHLFALQGLLRAYDGGKKMEKALEHVKKLEDALGGYDFALTMQKAGVERGLDPRAIHVLDEHVEAARAAAIETLQDGWLPGKKDGAKRLEKLVDAFVDEDLGKEKKDAAKLRGKLAGKIEDAADKAKDLDMAELETGLHELRRAVRWIPISFMALDGLVVLDEKPGPIKAFEALKQDPIAQSPYSKLPPPGSDKERISIPQSLFLALSKTINDLGTLKDEGQLVMGFAEVLHEAGVHKDMKSAIKAAEALVGEPGRLQRVAVDAEAARKALVKSGLLDALAAAVED